MMSGQKGADPGSNFFFPAIVITAVLSFIVWQINKPWTAEEAQDKITQCEKRDLSYIIERHETGPLKGRIHDVRCILPDTALTPSP